MSCCVSDCVRANCLRQPVLCTEDYEAQLLTIGTLAADTDYTVYFESGNTGVLKSVLATSDGDGLLTIGLDELAAWLNVYDTYTIWVTIEGADIAASEVITIGETEYTCFIIFFKFNDQLVESQMITV